MVINQSVNQSSMTCIKHTTPPLTLAGGGASRDDCIEVWGWFEQGSDLHLGLYSSLTSAKNLNLKASYSSSLLSPYSSNWFKYSSGFYSQRWTCFGLTRDCRNKIR